MKKTWNDVYALVLLYDDEKFNNLEDFVMKMKENKVSATEATLIWQCFDVAAFYFGVNDETERTEIE